ncbi:MAG: hypothetical protein KAR17_00445 [Cyclobacteriaceae bacterium]|jgi:hypothetical protein|nr:hypothetical protein [Cyclobacteriaceae bacterium]
MQLVPATISIYRTAETSMQGSCAQNAENNMESIINRKMLSLHPFNAKTLIGIYTPEKHQKTMTFPVFRLPLPENSMIEITQIIVSP